MESQEQEGQPVESHLNYRLVVLLGFVTFATTNFVARFVVPESASKTFQQRWKWKNVATSLIHSIITGIWSPLVFYQVRLAYEKFKIHNFSWIEVRIVRLCKTL
jgi:hypothetical protein